MGAMLAVCNVAEALGKVAGGNYIGTSALSFHEFFLTLFFIRR